MNTRMILASIMTAATLAACSSPSTLITPEDQGPQPTIDQIDADNDSSIDLAGTSGGLGKLVIRKIYDSNQNGKYDSDEAGVPNWGVRITSLYADGTPSQVSDIQVTPEGPQRWRGVVLNVVYGKYTIEELAPVSTNQAGTTWKVTGPASRTVSVSANSSVRGVEFAGACLENGAVVAFPKLRDFYGWKCRANFDLLPRIGSFTAEPNQIQSGGSSTLKWNVLDYSKLEITPGVGVVTGFSGSRNVMPTSNTAYTLKATNGFGSRTASVTVNVGLVRGWQKPQILVNAFKAATDTALVRDERGNALFVYTTGPSQPTAGIDTYTVHAIHNTAGVGWSNIETVGTAQTTLSPLSVEAQIASNGDTFIALGNQDQNFTVFRRPNQGVWDSGTNVSTGFVSLLGSSSIFGTLQTDALGNAFLAATGCTQIIDGQGCVSSNTAVLRFTPQSGWSSPVIASIANRAVFGVTLAVQPNGTVMQAWAEVTNGAINLAFASYTPSSGWSAPRPIPVTFPEPSSSLESLTANNTGGFDLLVQGETTICQVRLSNGVPETTHCTAKPAKSVLMTSASNRNEETVVLLRVNNSTTEFPRYEMQATRFTPSTGWSGSYQTLLSSRQEGSLWLNNPICCQHLSINEHGVAFGSVTVEDQTSIVPGISVKSHFIPVSFRYSPQTGWTTPEQLRPGTPPDDVFLEVFGPLTMPDDTAVAVWSETGSGGSDLWTNTYR